MCLSSIHDEDRAERTSSFTAKTVRTACFWLVIGTYRNEINLRDPKWRETFWKDQPISGMRKETKNVVDDKKGVDTIVMGAIEIDPSDCGRSHCAVAVPSGS